MSSKTPCGLAHPEPPRSHGFADNVAGLQARFGYPDNMSWELKKGKRLARIESDDPVAAATMFAGIASEGFESETTYANGYLRKMADGSFVGLRIITSSKGSPAVDLNIASESYVRKIHFYKGGN